MAQYYKSKQRTTVDGRNPAPPGIYKNPVNNRLNYQPQLVIAGFLPSTVSQGKPLILLSFFAVVFCPNFFGVVFRPLGRPKPTRISQHLSIGRCLLFVVCCLLLLLLLLLLPDVAEFSSFSRRESCGWLNRLNAIIPAGGNSPSIAWIVTPRNPTE